MFVTYKILKQSIYFSKGREQLVLRQAVLYFTYEFKSLFINRGHKEKVSLSVTDYLRQ